MENNLRERRVSFSDPRSQKHEGYRGGRNDKAWNWFQRPAFQDGNVRDDEHAAAVAAAAFAIHSLEEAESINWQKMREGSKSSRTQTMRRKEDGIFRRPSYGEASMRKSFEQDPRTAESAIPVMRIISAPFPKPISSTAGYQKQKGSPMQHNNVKTRADAWEKAKLEKIQKRYEKMKSKILSWEKERMLEVKIKMERKKSALEYRRTIDLQHYQNKQARINMIAQAARAQLEERRKKEESEAREKANIIQKTGRVTVKCFCFSFYQ